MIETPQCPDCEKPMEKGFIPEHTHYGAVQPLWHPGDPEKQTFFGMKLKNSYLKIEPTKTRKVISYRCSECGLLRSYAD